jgi:ABC-type lipoprotein release transport system permease subunit
VGALVTIDTLEPPGDSTKEFVVIDLRNGADVAAFQARMEAALDGIGTPLFQRDGRPSDILSLSRLRSLPLALAAVLVVLVAVTVLHAMIVAVRRRRRDIAVLQALGATRGEVTAIGVWQGITIGLAALCLGLPLGIVIGRWIWTLLANAFGTLAEPIVPLAGMAGLAVGVLALTALAGVVPIRRGLRTRPAQVLRSE